jgi:hypothetical protein
MPGIVVVTVDRDVSVGMVVVCCNILMLVAASSIADWKLDIQVCLSDVEGVEKR